MTRRPTLMPSGSTGLLVGTTVDGRFRVDGPLRRGGMGQLYRAWDLTTRRSAALKVLLPRHQLDRAAIGRLEVEARNLARVRHPNVVRVIGFGALDDGHPYLAMELLEGKDLDDHLVAHGSMGPAAVGEWLLPIARALDALHAANVVHRDVKPANIFRHYGTGGMVIKLVDFGLARQRASVRATVEGSAVGTPHYSAPELVEGEAGGPESDVYSLASVAFEMLGGQPPFPQERPVSVLTAKVSQPAPSLSSVLGVGSSRALDALFESALARDVQLRPRSCEAFIEAVVRKAQACWRPLEDDVAGLEVYALAPAPEVVRVLYLCPTPGRCEARAREALPYPSVELVTVTNLVEASARLRESAVALLVCDLGAATDVALPFIEALAHDGVPSIVLMGESTGGPSHAMRDPGAPSEARVEGGLPARVLRLPLALPAVLDAAGLGRALEAPIGS